MVSEGLVDMDMSQHWVPFYLWLRDAATFHPWEVRLPGARLRWTDWALY